MKSAQRIPASVFPDPELRAADSGRVNAPEPVICNVLVVEDDPHLLFAKSLPSDRLGKAEGGLAKLGGPEQFFRLHGGDIGVREIYLRSDGFSSAAMDVWGICILDSFEPSGDGMK